MLGGRLRSMLGKRVGLLVLGAASSLLACGGYEDSSFEVGRSQQAILEGYVDEVTSGVVGLGVQGDHYFGGHCSGALIAPNLVLTARHCISQSDWGPNASDVICGQTEFNVNRQPGSLVASPETERPTSPDDPSFIRGKAIHVVPGGPSICGYDVALLILEESFDSSQAVPIVPRIDERARNNESFSATGYGQTEATDGSEAGTRMRTDERSVMCTQSACDAFSEPLEPDTEWLSMDAHVCSGDSGGPALDDSGRVIGVVSRGPSSCDSAIYGDVAVWGDFIIQVALIAAREGGYDPPFWTNGSSDLPAGMAADATQLGGATNEPSDAEQEFDDAVEMDDQDVLGVSQKSPDEEETGDEGALDEAQEPEPDSARDDQDEDPKLVCQKGDDCAESGGVGAEAAACGFTPGHPEGWRGRVAALLLALFGWIRLGRRRRNTPAA
jgi:hypothetical protein